MKNQAYFDYVTILLEQLKLLGIDTEDIEKQLRSKTELNINTSTLDDYFANIYFTNEENVFDELTSEEKQLLSNFKMLIQRLFL